MLKRHFIHKLDNYQSHTPEEINILEKALSEPRRFGKGKDVIKQGDKPEQVYLLLDGWACRYKISPQGKLQVLTYLIPGDFCNIHITLANQIDYSIGVLAPSTFASLSHERIYDIYDNHPRLARSLNWSALIDISILQEWLVNLGSRPADQRLAHLLCELLIRSRAAGLTDDHHFRLPVTQTHLGEAMGITYVHTNRVMQKLRQERLITFANKQLKIANWRRMKEYADFDPMYLHLERAVPELEKDL